MPIPLTQDKVNFIHENKEVMKQKDIAAFLGITSACVSKILKKSKVINGYFNIDDFKKYYIA